MQKRILPERIIALSVFIVFCATVLVASNESWLAETANAEERSPAVTRLLAKADAEIDRRIESLSLLSQRIFEMKKTSSEGKENLALQIETERANLTALKEKIRTETDITVLREDVKSITASYRIYALIVPQIKILAAADRIDTIITSLKAITVKLERRISEVKNSEKKVATMSALIEDIKILLSDAEIQSAAAKEHVIKLIPDGGDKDVMAANTAELKIARADIKVAYGDFVDAKKYAGDILELLQEIDVAQNPGISKDDEQQ